MVLDGGHENQTWLPTLAIVCIGSRVSELTIQKGELRCKPLIREFYGILATPKASVARAPCANSAPTVVRQFRRRLAPYRVESDFTHQDSPITCCKEN